MILTQRQHIILSFFVLVILVTLELMREAHCFEAIGRNTANPCIDPTLRQIPEARQLQFHQFHPSSATSGYCYSVFFGTADNAVIAESLCKRLYAYMASFENMEIFESMVTVVMSQYNVALNGRRDGKRPPDFPSFWYIAPLSDDHLDGSILRYRESKGSTAKPVTVSGSPWIWFSNDPRVRSYTYNLTEENHSRFPCLVLAVNESATDRIVSKEDFYVGWRSCNPQDIFETNRVTLPAMGGTICLNKPAPKYYQWTLWSRDSSYPCDSDNRFRKVRECREYAGVDAITKTANDDGHCKGLVENDRSYEMDLVSTCVYEPMYTWGEWESWGLCTNFVKTRSRKCYISPLEETDLVKPVPCPQQEETQREGCRCYRTWSPWAACIEGVKTKMKCGDKTTASCVIEQPPSWTDWGLWSECYSGVRSKSRSCFKDTRLKNSYTELAPCVVDTHTFTESCEESCTWLAFAGKKETTFKFCYQVIGALFGAIALLWCLCLSIGCGGKKAGAEQLLENLSNIRSRKNSKNGKSSRKSSKR